MYPFGTLLHPFWDPFTSQGGTVPAPLPRVPPGGFLAPLGPGLSGQGPGVAGLAVSARVA